MLDVSKAIRVLEPYKRAVFAEKDEMITIGDIVDLLKAQEPRVMDLGGI